MAERKKISGFADMLLDQFPYGYVTVYDSNENDAPICEGIVRSLAKILDFGTLSTKSFFVAELEDGSVQIDIHV